MLDDPKRKTVLIATIATVLSILSNTGCTPEKNTSGLQSPTSGAPARSLSPQEKDNRAWVEEKAKASGGDFTKLSEEDRHKLVALLGPEAPFSLRQTANNLRQK